jgi:hypothetical protein
MPKTNLTLFSLRSKKKMENQIKRIHFQKLMISLTNLVKNQKITIITKGKKLMLAIKEIHFLKRIKNKIF